MHELTKITWSRQVAAAGEGERLRRLVGLSVADVAAQVGVHPVTLRRWETGQTVPTSAGAIRWFDALAAVADTLERREQMTR